jgi:hypothetical protein
LGGTEKGEEKNGKCKRKKRERTKKNKNRVK